MRVALLLAAIVATGVRPAVAFADTTGDAAASGSDTVAFTVIQDTHSPSNPVTHHHSTSPTTAPIRERLGVELRFNPATGQPCAYLFHAIGTDDPQSEYLAHRLVGQYGPCPGSLPLPTATSPGAAAIDVWRNQVKLPSPQPHIEPGWAITGKPAYLEINDPTTITATFSAFGYDISITATSTYDVDWGDGIVDHDLTSSGGPWPDGDVNHIYTVAKPYMVTVTQHWVADWTIGTETGHIADQLVTQGTIAIEARGLEAVRQR